MANRPDSDALSRRIVSRETSQIGHAPYFIRRRRCLPMGQVPTIPKTIVRGRRYTRVSEPPIHTCRGPASANGRCPSVGETPRVRADLTSGSSYTHDATTYDLIERPDREFIDQVLNARCPVIPWALHRILRLLTGDRVPRPAIRDEIPATCTRHFADGSRQPAPAAIRPAPALTPISQRTGGITVSRETVNGPIHGQ